jgi:hypothetical protein
MAHPRARSNGALSRRCENGARDLPDRLIQCNRIWAERQTVRRHLKDLLASKRRFGTGGGPTGRPDAAAGDGGVFEHAFYGLA